MRPHVRAPPRRRWLYSSSARIFPALGMQTTREPVYAGQAEPGLLEKLGLSADQLQFLVEALRSFPEFLEVANPQLLRERVRTAPDSSPVYTHSILCHGTRRRRNCRSDRRHRSCSGIPICPVPSRERETTPVHSSQEAL